MISAVPHTAVSCLLIRRLLLGLTLVSVMQKVRDYLAVFEIEVRPVAPK